MSYAIFVNVVSWIIFGTSIYFFYLNKKYFLRQNGILDRKKQGLKNVIESAEQMIDEINKLSDYVVTQISEKNKEIKVVKQELDDKLDQYKELIKKIEKTQVIYEDIIEKNSEDEDYEVFEFQDNEQKQIAVLELSQNGMSVSEIAKRLNIGQGEVKLIISMNK
jgi:DNA-binding NarL/FixJ family response regulator